MAKYNSNARPYKVFNQINFQTSDHVKVVEHSNLSCWRRTSGGGRHSRRQDRLLLSLGADSRPDLGWDVAGIRSNQTSSTSDQVQVRSCFLFDFTLVNSNSLMTLP